MFSLDAEEYMKRLKKGDHEPQYIKTEYINIREVRETYRCSIGYH